MSTITRIVTAVPFIFALAVLGLMLAVLLWPGCEYLSRLSPITGGLRVTTMPS